MNIQDISTAFYDAMFGVMDHSLTLNSLEQKALDKVRAILNSPELLSSHIPPLPAMVVKLLTVLKDANADFLDIASVIEHDPSLAMQVLKIANSPLYFHGNKEISSLNKAVGLLGVTGVANIATSIMMEKIRPQKPIYYKLFGKQIWLHSLHCAYLCKAIAISKQQDEFDSHFLGLIHDVGKIIIFNCLCEAFAEDSNEQTPGSQAFKQLMAEMSLDISAFIAQEWQLPEIYCQALSEQHFKRSSFLARVLFDANLLSEIYLMSQKGLIAHQQIEQVLKRMSLSRDIWLDFIEAVPAIESAIN